MYVRLTHQILTSLSPHALLACTQAIETEVGRCKDNVPRNGPRLLDLDVLFYDDACIHDGEHLIVPHPRIAERAFVLLPLLDILPHHTHPALQRTVEQLLHTLASTPTYDGSSIHRLLPFPRAFWAWGDRTRVMGILNATPNSFSDGGDHVDVAAAMDSARAMVARGVDVLDVGGASTAPHAPDVPPEEEARRVVVLVKALRADAATASTPISVDTWRASVAEHALEAGADMINDISGGQRDAAMLPLAARRRCPYVLMHMRGDAHTMTTLTDYQDDVVGTVAAELSARLEDALRAGVRRWNIILDPGIGFAKDAKANLALLRSLPRLVGGKGTRANLDSAGAPTRSSPTARERPYTGLAHFPVLVGASRKRFLGQLIQTDAGIPAPKHRVHATMAACTAAVATGCVDIIRVHDVAAAVDTVRTADAIVRDRA